MSEHTDKYGQGRVPFVSTKTAFGTNIGSGVYPTSETDAMSPNTNVVSRERFLERQLAEQGQQIQHYEQRIADQQRQIEAMRIDLIRAQEDLVKAQQRIHQQDNTAIHLARLLTEATWKH